MMNSLTVARYKIAIEHLNNSLVHLEFPDRIAVNEMIINYNRIIDLYNIKGLEVINPTNKELGQIKSSFPKIIGGFYSIKIKPNGIVDRNLYEEMRIKCNNTIIDKQIIDAKILLMRGNKDYWINSGTLEYQCNEYLKNEMIRCFYEQNKDFVHLKLI